MFLSKFFLAVVALLNFGHATAKVRYGGINIPGFDFGCLTNGTDILADVNSPLTQYGGNDGAGQMRHFTKQDHLNIFRLPVGWQFLLNDTLGGPLNSNNFAEYNALVQSCLSTGAHCIIDIHNYARWDGLIIGQGGPTDEQFASVWSQLATVYANETNVVFGIMNEPHDIPDINRWGQSVQAAVTAIRKAGATTQMILLPGNDYTGAQTFVENGSAAALANVTNLDGSITNLIYDVHKYLDIDGSGTHPNCVANHINDTFAPLAQYLRSVDRVALLSEIGGGSNNTSCIIDVCQVLDFLNYNSDVYLGYLGWGAGSLSATTYVLSLTPFESTAPNGRKVFRDQLIAKKCFVAKFNGH